ncbi:hypothetical protein LINPERPRIM_LOCUS14592 [Linum perenne]
MQLIPLSNSITQFHNPGPQHNSTVQIHNTSQIHMSTTQSQSIKPTLNSSSQFHYQIP